MTNQSKYALALLVVATGSLLTGSVFGFHVGQTAERPTIYADNCDVPALSDRLFKVTSEFSLEYRQSEPKKDPSKRFWVIYAASTDKQYSLPVAADSVCDVFHDAIEKMEAYAVLTKE